MGKKTKPFIDKKTAAHFHVVHRSLHDEVCILVLAWSWFVLVLFLPCFALMLPLSYLVLVLILPCFALMLPVSCLILPCLALVLPVSVYPSAVRVSQSVCQLVCLRVSSLAKKQRKTTQYKTQTKTRYLFVIYHVCFYCLVLLVFLLGCRRRERL